MRTTIVQIKTQPNTAEDEVRGQIASGESGTDDADAFFANLEA